MKGTAFGRSVFIKKARRMTGGSCFDKVSLGDSVSIPPPKKSYAFRGSRTTDQGIHPLRIYLRN